jgi:hypothetical protein
MLRPNGAPIGWLSMTYKTMHVRSGLTAIAAVLALSSTPLGAQEVTTPPDPVTETPAPAPEADPLAPEPVTSEPAAEPAPAVTTAKKAPAKARAATPARAARQPERTAAPAASPPASEATVETSAVLPPPPVPVAEPPIAEPVAPLAAEPAPATSNLMADETLPIAGAAGLGLLALGGIGIAMQRRRRRREELAHHRAAAAYLDEHQVKPEPAFVRPSRPAVAAPAPEAAVRTGVPQTKLPAGFDLSRFGPHVRAAYLGPTPDNPSLSMKYRVRRAAAMDKQDQLEAEKRPAVEARTARAEPARQPAWAASDEGFMLRRSTTERRREIAQQSRASAES